MGRSSRIPRNRKDIEERRAKVAECLRKRMTYRQIGKELGVCASTITNDVKEIVKVWKERQSKAYDEHVMIQLATIDDVIDKLQKRFDKGDYDMCDKMLKWLDRQSKLLGLDDFYNRGADKANPIQIVLPKYMAEEKETEPTTLDDDYDQSSE